MSHTVQVLNTQATEATIRHKRCTKVSVHRFRQAPKGAGFTLVELMIVVAIVGILASLAVMYFGGTTKKVKAKSEVSSMFSEFKLRQEAYQLENGRYLSSGANESDTWPASPGSGGGKVALRPMRQTWIDLRMAPDAGAVYCSYVAIAGEGGDATNVDTVGTEFGYVPPATDWYYLVAQCDMNQKPGIANDSIYFQHSESSELFFIRQGQ